MTGADVYRPVVMSYCLVGLLLAASLAERAPESGC